ncbi:hypothetical protein AMS68_003936 [Peltaster fructicola]|uniref:Uncharacterized protein n=1 Tax=Peltaster fructicola TaxID=286661 RepID=A0A6H0XUW4_9PEZI|nr:hypothetical protein AMS68_003936 [Peltaster fructicola]
MRAAIFRLLPLLACSALVSADANSVISAFNQVNADLVKLDIDVNATPSGIVGIGPALQVSVDSVTVDNDLIATQAQVTRSSVFTASESNNIVNAIQQVAGTANTTIADVIKQYNTFGGLAPVVLAALYQLRQDQNNLGVSLYSKLDSSQLNRGIQILVGLNQAFGRAITAYGGTP